MPLHPQAATFLNLVAGSPPRETISPEANRKTTRESIPLTGEPTQLAAIEDLTLDIASGTITVRVYRPNHKTGLAVATYFHGAGWVGGDLNSHDRTARGLASASGVVVVAVNYRLAPEHPFPAA